MQYYEMMVKHCLAIYPNAPDAWQRVCDFIYQFLPSACIYEYLYSILYSIVFKLNNWFAFLLFLGSNGGTDGVQEVQHTSHLQE